MISLWFTASQNIIHFSYESRMSLISFSVQTHTRLIWVSYDFVCNLIMRNFRTGYRIQPHQQSWLLSLYILVTMWKVETQYNVRIVMYMHLEKRKERDWKESCDNKRLYNERRMENRQERWLFLWVKCKEWEPWPLLGEFIILQNQMLAIMLMFVIWFAIVKSFNTFQARKEFLTFPRWNLDGARETFLKSST